MHVYLNGESVVYLFLCLGWSFVGCHWVALSSPGPFINRVLFCSIITIYLPLLELIRRDKSIVHLILRATPSVPKKRNLGLDVTYSNTINLDKGMSRFVVLG